MSKSYRVHEFAERTGLTVKALYHYDRLGLLNPRRTASGYRLYSDRDVERAEQIAALKFLGISLRQIKAVLDRTGLPLAEALRRQRVALEEKHRALAGAIGAIQNAEQVLASGKAAEALAWRRIIEIIAMQNDSEAMRKYYSADAWLKRKQHYEHWPPPEFEQLFREIGAALGESPESEKTQALKARWRQALNDRATGDPEVQAGALAAWNDREHWPASLRQKIEELKIEQAVEFLAKAVSASWKRFIASEDWARLEERQRNPTEPWNQWYMRVRAALEEDTPREAARAMVLRMTEL